MANVSGQYALRPRSLSNALIACALLCGGTAAATAEGLPPLVKKSLQDNAAALSPLTVAWTQEYKSALPKEVARERIGLQMPATTFFHRSPHRLIWQDAHMYCSWETLHVLNNGSEVLGARETAVDGKCIYIGVHNGSDTVLFKRFLPKAIASIPSGANVETDYFRAAGLRLPLKMEEWSDPHANSEVLWLLEQGGRLKSVGHLALNGHDVLRIEIDAANPVKQRWVRQQNESETEDGVRSDTPKQRQDLQARRDQWRTLPATRTFVFLLDPTLHFAMLQREEWYQPTTLLQHCVASNFQKVPGRELWLPRKCEIDLYEFDLVPGVFFKDPIISQVFDVSQIDGDRVPESSFILNYTDPGTRINDGTIPDAKQDRYGYTRYVVPARAADLEQVIERARRGESSELASTGVSTYGLAVALNIAIALFIAALLLWRRFRRDEG